MIKIKHIEDIIVKLRGGNYPSLHDDGLPFEEKIADINWLGSRELTIATALLFAQSPKMFEVVRELIEWKQKDWEDEEHIDGGDAVEFLGQLRVKAHEALAPYINHPILNQKGLRDEDPVEGG